MIKTEDNYEVEWRKAETAWCKAEMGCHEAQVLVNEAQEFLNDVQEFLNKRHVALDVAEEMLAEKEKAWRKEEELEEDEVYN